MSLLLTLQDDSGVFELVGNPFKITGAVGDVDDLKKVLTSNIISFILLREVLTSNGISFILFCGTFFRREMTNVKQRVRVYNICCEFMVFCSCAMLCLSWR